MIQATATLPVCRLQNGTSVRQTDTLAEETPVALVYNGISHVVLMATPQDLSELALGFSLSEGILQHPGQMYDCEIAGHAQGIEIRIEIAAERFALLKERRRSLTGRTGCGLCGIDSLTQALPEIPAVKAVPDIRLSDIETALQQFDDSQPLRAQTGSLHAAAWFADGRIRHTFEDVGRHNALDKLIGRLKAEAADTSGGFILVSSRASYEMVLKTVQAGIGCLTAVSAPTALAVRIAEQAGLMLVGFARAGRQTVYTFPENLRPEQP